MYREPVTLRQVLHAMAILMKGILAWLIPSYCKEDKLLSKKIHTKKTKRRQIKHLYFFQNDSTSDFCVLQLQIPFNPSYSDSIVKNYKQWLQNL